MEGKKHSIVVPYDFSEQSDIALTHAARLANKTDSSLYLAHFIDDGGLFTSKSKIKQDEDKIYDKLEAIKDDLVAKYKIPDLNFIVKSGKVKSSIKFMDDFLNVNLFVMGTDYKSDKVNFNAFEFLSYIKSTTAPVIFTKLPPIHENYRELVIPVEYDKKYKEELKWVIYLAKFYNCNINMIRLNYDDELKKRYVENNVYFTKKMLDANNIVYGIKLASSEKSFKESIFNFSHSIDADLVMIMSYKFKDYVCDKNNNLDNSEPTSIMVINPRADLKNYQGFY